MKLILCGGGNGKGLIKGYKKFAEFVKDKMVLFIPIASENIDFDLCYKRFKNEMKIVGVTNIYMVRDSKEITKDVIDKVGGVFVGDGNVFKLLHELKTAVAYKVLENYLLNDPNSVFMGVGAGAVICGKNVLTAVGDELNLHKALDQNKAGVGDFDGFNLLDDISVFVHYKKNFFTIRKIKKRIKKLCMSGENLLCLPEKTCFVAEDENCFALGKLAEYFDGLDNKKFTHKCNNDCDDNHVHNCDHDHGGCDCGKN